MTVKWIPAPIKMKWAYWNEEEWIISYVGNSWSTIITMQDKNFWATEACTEYYLWNDSRNFRQEIIWTKFFPTSTKTIQDQLIEQGLLPSGMHVYNETDYDACVAEWMTSWSFNVEMLAPLTTCFPDYTLEELNQINRIQDIAIGEIIRYAYNYLYWSTKPYSIRLIYNTPIVPIYNGKWKKLKEGQAPGAGSYVDGVYSLIA